LDRRSIRPQSRSGSCGGENILDLGMKIYDGSELLISPSFLLFLKTLTSPKRNGNRYYKKRM
jgi:hypothetical protein